jgi:hypothetical protein
MFPVNRNFLINGKKIFPDSKPDRAQPQIFNEGLKSGGVFVNFREILLTPDQRKG